MESRRRRQFRPNYYPFAHNSRLGPSTYVDEQLTPGRDQKEFILHLIWSDDDDNVALDVAKNAACMVVFFKIEYCSVYWYAMVLVCLVVIFQINIQEHLDGRKTNLHGPREMENFETEENYPERT